MAHKIVVIGDVNGKIKEVITKLSNLHKKQNFALAIIAGTLFGPFASEVDAEVQDLLDGKIDVPLPTYVSLGQQALPSQVVERLEKEHGEICPNLICFGKKTRIKTTEGFRIVAVTGSHQENAESNGQWTGSYLDQDASAAISYNEADILITSDWPEGIRTGSTAAYAGEQAQEIQSIGKLCSALKPKYHFSVSSAFFEREPFFHDTEPPRPITRFISLAPYGNAEKQKWIYAFSLDSSASPPDVIPAGTTASPLGSSRKRGLDSQKSAFNSFRFSNGEERRDEHRGKRRKNQKPLEPDQCYFCLSNPSCETHMVGSIGDDSYLTVAKGPLTTRDTFPDLQIPFHMLIIPLVHTATLGSMEGDAKETTRKEMDKYREALQTCVASKSKDDSGRSKLGAVTWEISRSGGVHHHWQFLPVPADLIASGKLEAVVKAEAESLNYAPFTKDTAEIASMEEGNFFKLMVWSEDLQYDMVMPLDETFRFDMQFGRRLMGKLMKLESRTHWKDCGQSKLDEESDVARFKQMFEPFDFSLA